MDRASKLELLKVLEAKKSSEHDKVLESRQYSLIQRCYLLSTAKIAILSGANQSGKSLVGADDICINSTGVIPESLRDEYPQELIRLDEYWVSALDFPSSEGITQKKIKESCPKRYIQHHDKELKKMYLLTGSEIGFKSAESKREKYQGEAKVKIWLDEEHPKEIWDECYMRVILKSGRLRMTFSPIKGLTWAYSDAYLRASKYYYTKNKHGINEDVGLIHTPDEIAKLKDRELVIMPNTAENADPNIEVYIMTLYDNKFLADAEIQRAEIKYQNDPANYEARILGRFSKNTGRNVFDRNKLAKMQASLPTTFTKGDIVGGRLRISVRGHLTIFKEKKDIDLGHYVIGADIAEGLEHGDYSCAQIVDHKTCEQVAMWHGHCSPEEFAYILVDLAKYYNNALLAPERNFHGVGVVERIRKDIKYPRLYCHYDVAQDALRTSASNLQKKYGWETTARTKPILIQDLAQFIRDGHLKINDYNTIEELITYTYDKLGHTEAMGGCYDDRVMALAIAIQLYQRPIPKINDQTYYYNKEN